MFGAHVRCFVASLGPALLISLTAIAADWPQWRYDGQHSAASPHELPHKLSLLWVRELPRLTPAWSDQAKMQFDAAYEPVVAGQRLFISSSHDNSVTAYDTRTGEELWTFFTDGPVRFAPLAWQDKLYFVSDDGYLYCLKAADGSLVWRFRGGPDDRKILGNERLISMWPARGAPVIAEGKIYFAAGIWPFMGIFLHALDAESGSVVWTNDGDGSTYIKQPHNADSFAGVAPQGYLAVSGDKLLVPGGRSVPACYDRHTGKMVYYQLAENAKKGGGFGVAVAESLILNGGAAFDLAAETYLGACGELATFADGRLYETRGGELRVLDLKSSQFKIEESVDRKGKATKSAKWSIQELMKVESPVFTTFIKAGSRLYAGSKDGLIAISLPLTGMGIKRPAWEAVIEGTPTSLIAADERLFVVTVEGRIYCFGAAATELASSRKTNSKLTYARSGGVLQKTKSVLNASRVKEGYCVVFGIGHGVENRLLLSDLTVESDLRVIVVERDAGAANACRQELREARCGSEKVTVITAEPKELELPPYLASLAIVNELPAAAEERAAFVAKVFASLRPFGGVACLPIRENDSAALVTSLKTFNLENATWKPAGEMTLLVREGPLPGSADWTHEHADAANTRVSKDTLVKAPLGLLWFGGAGNEAILPRHGHGPQPQVCQGRSFIEGMDILRCTDIYTGRLLWEAPLPGVGELYNNTAHQPGANSSGTNFIATPEGVYVAYKNSCVKLEPVTGKRIGEYRLPAESGSAEASTWGYLNVDGEYLVGGANPLFNSGLKDSRGENDNYSSSRRLVVMERASGKVLWTATARAGFRHNAICLGGSKLFAIDRVSGPELSRLKRRGENGNIQPRLVAFDLASGKELWSTEQDVFGTWLSYSAERDVLVEAGRVASDTISDEPKGMRAYQATTGIAWWENMSFSGPAMLHHGTVLMAGKACDLMTGALKMREHPLSGEPVEWGWSRNYGCNTPMASEHLLTFRSGAAGYFDLCSDGGTGNFGGFRSSCSNNLVVAGGLLTAPDYTRTCVCSYQNQTSIALVPMPDVETWTFVGAQLPTGPVRRLGINLGAPGDRKAEDGTLWLEFPSVGGASPSVEVTTEPKEPQWFRRHSLQVQGPGLNWVAASGAKGLTTLRIKLADKAAASRKYTVRLHFLEPDDVQAGDRVFDVSVQGAVAIHGFDVVREAGGRNRAVSKTITGVVAGEELLLTFVPSASARFPASVLSGVEVQAEGW